ncbi:MAG: hypothetical protein ABIG46_08840 [Candidatus Omnitrophota bacterium]|nr:hypothetical protein [Candidatus Omnitrophota bacterium]
MATNESAEAAKVQEKQTNCLACNKPLKKIKQYYRNQKYYCSKKCWKKSLKPKEEQQ